MAERYFSEIAMAVGSVQGDKLCGLMGTAVPLTGHYLATAAHVLDDLDRAIGKWGGKPVLARAEDDGRLSHCDFKIAARWDEIDCALLTTGIVFHPGQDRVLPGAANPPGAGSVVQTIGFGNVSFDAFHSPVERGHVVSARSAIVGERVTPPAMVYEVSFRAAPGLSGAGMTMEYAGVQLLLGIVLGEIVQTFEKREGELAAPPSVTRGYVVGIEGLLAKSFEGRTVRSMLIDELKMAHLE